MRREGRRGKGGRKGARGRGERNRKGGREGEGEGGSWRVQMAFSYVFVDIFCGTTLSH